MISEQGFTEIADQVSNNLPHLKHLSLKFDRYQISLESIIYLYRNSNENMGDKSFINFFRVIGPSLKKLETLEVSFRTRKQYYMNYLLFLINHRNRITDQALESLANKFSDSFQTLKSLVLNFEGYIDPCFNSFIFISCTKLTSEAVSKLIKSIGTNLKNLKHLDLNFNGYFSNSNLSKLRYTVFSFLMMKPFKPLLS
jgi:hypothetical protein